MLNDKVENMSLNDKQEQSLFDELGGEPTFNLVIDKFYERIMNDGSISPMFDGVDMIKQKKMLGKFLAHVFGQREYSGRTMKKAHERLNITNEHFDAVMGHMGAVLTELKVPEDKINTIATTAETTRVDIVKQQSLFDELGGEPTFNLVIDKFYERIMNDGSISPMFDGVDMIKQKKMLGKFLAHVFGQREYSGRTMKKAHERLNITNEHFDAVMGHMGAVLTELKVPEDKINTIATTAETTRVDIVASSGATTSSGEKPSVTDEATISSAIPGSAGSGSREGTQK